MSLTRVRYADLVALPSLDEIKARKAAAKAQRASETAAAREPETSLGSAFVTIPETATVAESTLPVKSVESATVIPSDTVADTLAPTISAPISETVPKSATVVEITCQPLCGEDPETVSEIATPTIRNATGADAETVSDSMTVPASMTVSDGSGTAVTSTVPYSANVSFAESKSPNAPRARRASRVQDGHSSGEQCLYAVMWENARPATRDYRIITAGWDRLGRMANLTSMNARAACRRLIEKLAVDVIAAEDSDSRTGRTYRVWSWAALLERRTQAGMEWYVKTRGVEFVRPPATDPAAMARWDIFQARIKTETVAVSPMQAGIETVPLSITVPKTGRGTVPLSEIGTVSVSETPLKQVESKESKTSSSVLVDATPDFDDDARRKLLSACRAIRADATENEVAHFVAQKREQFRHGRKQVDNPIGLLIAAVPKYFEGPDLDLYRQEIRQQPISSSDPRRVQLEAEHQAALQAEEIWMAMTEAEKSARIEPIRVELQQKFAHKLSPEQIAQNAADRALSEFVREHVAKID